MLRVLTFLILTISLHASEGTTIAQSEEPTIATEKAKEVIPIIKDERHEPLRGNFEFNFETGDGIKRTEKGIPTGTRTGVVRFPLPNGEIFELKFKAGSNGFEPESSFLPKAPVFPHPLPPHAKE